MPTSAESIERARQNLRTCMQREDFPYHNCACNCGDVAELLAELSHLRLRLDIVTMERDQYLEQRNHRAKVIERYRAAMIYAPESAPASRLPDG